MDEESNNTSKLKLWPKTSSRNNEFRRKDTVPFASNDDIGRRVLRRNQEGWDCVGVIITYDPMEEIRITNGKVSGEIGEEMSDLYNNGHVDRWTILYGNGDVAELTTLALITGLQLHNKAASSAEIRNSLKLTAEMLDYENFPPGFAAYAPTTMKAPGGTNITFQRIERDLDSDTDFPDEPGEPVPNINPVVENKRRGRRPSAFKTLSRASASAQNSSITSSNAELIATVDLVEDEQKKCEICKSALDPKKLVHCDGCEKCFHAYCTSPPLVTIPKGKWKCNDCVEIYTCEQCGKLFKSKPGIKYHMANVCVSEEELKSREAVKAHTTENNDDDLRNNSANAVGLRRCNRKRKTVQYVDQDLDTFLDELDKDETAVDDESAKRHVNRGANRVFERRKLTNNSKKLKSVDDDLDDEQEEGIDVNGVDEDDDDDVTEGSDLYRNLGCRRHSGSSICGKNYETSREKFIRNEVYRFAADAISSPGSDRFDVIVVKQLEDLLTNLWAVEAVSVSEWLGNQNPLMALPEAPVVLQENSGGELLLDSFTGVTRSVNLEMPPSKAACSIDCFLNASGPIWDMAFAAPHTEYHLSQAEPLVKYLAVGVSRIGWPTQQEWTKSGAPWPPDVPFTGFAKDIIRAVGKPIKHPNLLQIWRLDGRDVDMTPPMNMMRVSGLPKSDQKLRVAYCVGLSARGSIWKLAWNPHFPYWVDTIQRLTEAEKSPKERQLLGVLAVVCGDGTCLILALPKSVQLSNTNTSDPQIITARTYVPVVVEESVTLCTLQLDTTMIMSVAWNPYKKWQLVTGMKDGTIIIWNIDPILSTATSTIDTPTPTVLSYAIKPLPIPVDRFTDLTGDPFSPSVSAVNSLQFCPYHPNLLASAGYDGTVKIWNLNQRYGPVNVRHPLVGWVYDLCWDPHGHGIVYTGSDSPQVSWEPLWTISIKDHRRTTYTHTTRFAGVWKVRLQSCDDQSMAVSVCSDGTVRCTMLSLGIYRGVKRAMSEVYVEEPMRVLEVKERVESNGAVRAVVAVILDQDSKNNPEIKSGNDKDVPAETVGIQAVTTSLLLPPHLSNSALQGCAGSVGGLCLLAYGGACGIGRVHTLDIVRNSALS